MFSTDDTICAIASAPGGAARGVVRVAGPQAIHAVADCFAANQTTQLLTKIRRATAIDGTLCVDAFTVPVPCTLYLWPGPASYTRSAMAELHTIGSPPLLEAVLATLGRHDVRLAKPGEFTMRAFLAGRMDLTQAEAVLGVIDANNERQLEVALRQLAGGLASPLADVRESLLNLLAELEAGLDFVEEDIEFITESELTAGVRDAACKVSAVAAQLATRTDERQLARVVLVGSTNVGKSTLFNAILARTTATDHAAPSIVTAQAGTTRDYRTASITHGAATWQLVDTAGVEQAEQDQPTHSIPHAPRDVLPHAEREGYNASPEALAQAATNQQHHDADIRVLCIDVSRTRSDWEAQQLAISPSAYTLVVATKADLAACSEGLIPADVSTSGATGSGLEELLTRIDQVVTTGHASGEMLASTAARCRESLTNVSQCLAHAESLVADDGGHEIIAAELRIALDHLGQVVGVVYTDDILDRIFSRFCIGK